MSHCGVEGLERRTLLSATLVNGLLTVDGTAAGDNIIVGGSPTVFVSLNFAAEPGSPFSGVTGIVINGLAGPDKIKIDSSLPTSIPVTVLGGGGADTITANGGHGILRGGRGADSLMANATQYLLAGGRGNDTLIATGAANDIFRGGAGSDSVSVGDGGFYVVDGGGGANSVVANRGNDTILSSSGVDNIVASVTANALIYDSAGGSSIIGHGTGDSGADTIFTVGSVTPIIPGGSDVINSNGKTHPPHKNKLLAFLNAATDPAQLPPRV